MVRKVDIEQWPMSFQEEDWKLEQLGQWEDYLGRCLAGFGRGRGFEDKIENISYFPP